MLLLSPIPNLYLHGKPCYFITNYHRKSTGGLILYMHTRSIQKLWLTYVVTCNFLVSCIQTRAVPDLAGKHLFGCLKAQMKRLKAKTDALVCYLMLLYENMSSANQIL